MRYRFSRALLWAAGYLLVALAPMLVAYLGPLSPRSFWIELGVGLGFIGVGVLFLQFILTGRFQRLAPSFGLDSMLAFHRQAGIAALVLVLAHPTLLLLADPGYLEYFDPRVNLPRALALAGVTGATLLVVASSLWRVAFRLDYERWRLVHGLLSAFILLIAVVHPIQVGHYVSGPWKVGFYVLLGLVGFGLLGRTRLYRPWKLRSRPWRLAEIREEAGDASTLVFTPVGHRGLLFVPGQFAWITLKDTPFSLQQHPYSISSGADSAPGRLEFTIKEEGDFSARARKAKPGETAFLEGPYGCFVPPADPDRGCVMLVGGVGVTPCMSMLRTFAQREDRRPVTLIYANVTLEEVIFLDELEALEERLDLEIVHVLEEPPEGWEGESGLLDRELLERHLPDDRDAFDYFICGPEPMMDIAERELLGLGVRQRRILSERFNMV